MLKITKRMVLSALKFGAASLLYYLNDGLFHSGKQPKATPRLQSISFWGGLCCH